jgi:excisionase family DNA binding protein
MEENLRPGHGFLFVTPLRGDSENGMDDMKTVFTTGEAAKICKVSQQTIIRCFDSGQLGGFRVPGSRFRRIPRDVLYKFMKENGIPTDALESGKRKALVVDDDEELVEMIRDVLDADGRFEVRIANNGFDAGMMVKEYKPDIIVLDVMLPDINGKEVCQRVRSDESMDDVKIICISGMVEADKIEDLRKSGANDFMQKPFEVEKLIDRMCGLLDVERKSA